MFDSSRYAVGRISTCLFQKVVGVHPDRIYQKLHLPDAYLHDLLQKVRLSHYFFQRKILYGIRRPILMKYFNFRLFYLMLSKYYLINIIDEAKILENEHIILSHVYILLKLLLSEKLIEIFRVKLPCIVKGIARSHIHFNTLLLQLFP